MIDKNEQLCCFNNKKEELEYYKSKYESFFKELVKYQLKVKSLENSNNKLREKVSNFLNLSTTKNNNNSEENFLTPVEFKKLWEYIIKTELIETFDFCINEYILISNLCQDIMLLVYEECQKKINNKFIEVLNCLNLGKISKNKREEIYNNFLPFFRENFNNFSDNFLDIINNKLLSVIKEYNYSKDIMYGIENDNNNTKQGKINNKDINNIFINKIKEKITENNFSNLIKSFYKICIYMILHEPKLTFDLQKYSQRKMKYFYFNENDFINVDGFIKENNPCIILLSAPLLKNKFNFHDLRAPVYILDNADKNIIEECERNKKNNLENIEFNLENISDGIDDEYINNNKKNKTFEEACIKNNWNKKESPKNNKGLNNSNINKTFINSCNNIIKNNGVYNDIDLCSNNPKLINENNEYKSKKIYDKGIKINNSVDKPSKINEINSNSIDSKILYVISQPNTINKSNNQNPANIAQNYINNIDKANANNIYKNKNNKYFLSSSSGNIGIRINEKYEGDKECNQNNNKINNLQNEQNIYDVIMGNLNKLKETKLKEYYINNKKKNKNGIKNKNSNYCIKNHIYMNIKNMPNTANNRFTTKKNNFLHTNSQHFDLILDKKISPSPSNLFKSYETYNDSSEINNPSPKNDQYKNYNSFTHLLKFSNMNSICSSNSPILSSQNTPYNNLVLKGIKNNFDNNNKKKAKHSSSNINYKTNYKINNKINFNNISNTNNANSIHSSNVTKNNFNPLSNRKKYISHIKNNDNKSKENKSEIKERCSLNNYLKIENKTNNKNKNNSNKINIYNNIQRNSNVVTNKTNNIKKNKKIQKNNIKNSILISEGNNYNQQNLNLNINCKKINNNIKNKNNNLNNKNRYKNNNSNNNNNKNNNKYNITNKNYTIFKNNNNIKIKGIQCINKNNINEESNLFKFSPNNTYIQKTINKSSSPDNKYIKNKKNKNNDINDKNNILFHRNSNTTLYNKYFTSESENNISSNKNNQHQQQSFQVVKKTKRKVSNNNHSTYTNNYIKKNKNNINKHKEKVIKYIKTIKLVNKYGTNNKKESENLNQNFFGLKQIYKNSKYNLKKPINSLPIEIYVKTEENNKENNFKEMPINKKYIKDKENEQNKTIEENKNVSSSSLKKNKAAKRQINLGNNNNYITFDKLNNKKVK